MWRGADYDKAPQAKRFAQRQSEAHGDSKIKKISIPWSSSCPASKDLRALWASWQNNSMFSIRAFHVKILHGSRAIGVIKCFTKCYNILCADHVVMFGLSNKRSSPYENPSKFDNLYHLFFSFMICMRVNVSTTWVKSCWAMSKSAPWPNRCGGSFWPAERLPLVVRFLAVPRLRLS